MARPRPDILLVDDDPDVCRSLARALQTAGYAVERAGHGADALEKLANQRFAVVVCDLMMPVMDGMRFYERLQNTCPETADRVVFITGWAHDPRIRRFLKRTRRPTLLKPFEIDDFLAEVARVAG